MHLTHRVHRRHSLVLGCLTAALLATQFAAGGQIDYTDLQTDASGHDTSSTLTVSILSGTATQSGILSGSGRLLKVGAGTLVLSGVNTYTNDTVVHFGALQVVAGANMSQSPANIFVADVSGDIGTLLISGGSVGSNSGYIGTHAGGSGTVTVTSGSWSNGDTLYLGNEGTGVMNLSGGSVSDYSGLVGFTAGSNGSANVSGGTWVNVGNIEVGYRGTGVLTLTGGSVTSANGYLGSNAGSAGTVNISGGSWGITDNFYIGHSTTGVVNLSSGGSLSDTGATLGYNAGSSGTATVSGGSWTNTGDFTLGSSGTGVLNLSGGSVTAQVVYQGLNAGSSGTLNVSNGTLTNNTSYFLGYSGSGVLNLSGGSISNAASSVGFGIGSSGTANVSGGIWTNNNGLVIGESGTGVLHLSGGSITADVVSQGLNAGSSGTVTMSNGTLTNNTSYFLGYSGSGVLNLSGGSISNAASSVGFNVSSSGTANVSGGSWTNNGSLVIGESGTGVLNLSGGGGVSSTSSSVGLNAGSSGTAHVSGGSWTSSGDLIVGNDGTGVLNLSGGSMSNASAYVGHNAGGSGTVTMTGGTWTSSGELDIGYFGTGVLNLSGGSITSGDLNVGYYSTGTLNLSGGSISSSASYVGGIFGATAVANVSGGTWSTSNDFYIGFQGIGTVNLTDAGTITAGATGGGRVFMGMVGPGSGTLNLGTGGVAGTLNAASIFGGHTGAIVNFNHTGSYSFAPTLTGEMEVNQIGSGTTTLAAANTYMGATSVLGGTLELSFGTVSTNILPTTTALTLGSGTLRLTGEGTQTVNGLFITQYSSASSIVLGAHETLDVGQITLSGSFNTLNFNTAAGGADGATAGSGVIVIHDRTSGSAIASSVTVTDATGFGLATVDAADQIIRLTPTTLLPASGASATDYLINNNNGGSAAAGSSTLTIATSQSVGSITVDTTATSGTLTLSSGVVLSSDVWNFGGGGGNAYAITGSGSGTGITTATARGLLQINNYNTAPVILSAAIRDNDGLGLRVAGPGTTILAGTNSYTGDTTVSTGVLEVTSGGSINSPNATVTIGSWSGGNAVFNIHGGTVTDTFGVLAGFEGSHGVATVGPDGLWSNSDSLRVGLLGTGVLNITGGTVTDNNADLGYVAASQGTVTMTAGSWTTSNVLNIGREGTGVLNLSGGSISSTSANVGLNAGSSGTANVSGGSWTSSSDLYLGLDGSGVLNLTAGSVSNAAGIFGYSETGSGTANVSGGSWTSSGELMIGYLGSGVLNLTSGAVSSSAGTVGYYAGGTGTVNVSGGSWTMSGDLRVGNEGTGILNLSGGSVSNDTGYVGNINGSSGTVTVSGGTWTNNSGLYIGNNASTGVLNLTGSGVVAVGVEGSGTLNLGYDTGSHGTLNLGTGGVAGTLYAATVYGDGSGEDGQATVNFNQSGSYLFAPKLDGFMNVNFTGSGTTTFSTANTYSGVTSVLGGTLELNFGEVARDILPVFSDVILGSGTLQLSGSGMQSLPSISTRDDSAGSIELGGNNTLAIGGLNTTGQASALNFNTAAGGVITLAGQTAGAVINPGFTVTDSTGFGLATVNAGDQVIRLSTPLLPAVGALSGTDYLINNNSGDSSTAGSAQLQISDSATVHSITVDTTATSGSLVLGEGATLSTDVWNFGAAGGDTAHDYYVTGGALTSATAGGTLQINNDNRQPIFIDSPIVDHGGMTLLFQGTGATVLTGTSSGLKDVKVTSGALVVTYGGSLSYTGTTTIGSQTGDNAILAIVDGSVQGADGVIGDAAGAQGLVILLGNGAWTQDSGDLILGKSGTGVLNIGDGGSSTTQNAYLGVNAGSSGTATVENGGSWYVNSGLHIGGDGAGVVNVNGGYISVGLNGSGGGTVTLGTQGVLNMGTGAGMGSLGAATVDGALGSMVNFNYSALFRNPRLGAVLAGDLAVTKSGSASAPFLVQNTYTGSTSVNGGILHLGFSSDSDTDLISPASALIMGGGTLQLTANGTQTLIGLTTTASTASRILLAANDTLHLGTLSAAGTGSALNFDLAAGGADGSTPGSGIILLSGQTAGAAINPGFTVTDATGFGLATVNEANQVIRLSSTPLLPASGADARTDYRIDNNDGGSTAAGSSALVVSTSETARSITVDTSASPGGLLTLGSGVVLKSDVWNIGGTISGNYAVTTSSETAGISTATPGGMLQINNYNLNIVSINTPILDNDGSGLRAGGTGTTLLNGDASYKGETLISSGTLLINGDHSAATGAITVNSAATLGGTGTLGGDIHVQNGGLLQPGNALSLGTLSGTTATFDSSSVFSVAGGSAFMTSFHLSGAVTIHTGALLFINITTDLTAAKYTLLSAASGLDGFTPFTLVNNSQVPEGYHLVYTGTTLELDVIGTTPATAYWTGKVDANWSSFHSGSTNWATTADGLTDTTLLPDAPTDVTFSATGVGSTQTNLDVNFTLNSLTINSDTGISSTDSHILIVNTTTAVNARLSLGSGVTLYSTGAFTIGSEGTLAGSGSVLMALDQSTFVNGAISVGDPAALSGQVLSLYNAGTGAVIMGAGSSIHVNLFSGAGLGDNTALSAAADQLRIVGTLNATAGGTLVIGNPSAMTSYAGGDQWKVIDLNSGASTITGHLALNDSALGLTTGFTGTFDQITGIYSIADHRPELTAHSSGLPMANAEGQSIISGSQTATNDVNNHLFNLRSGGGEEDSDGSIASSMDDGVIMGQGDGPEDPIARRVKRTRQWEVFTTVNYGNARLNPISNQSGVQIDSWASSVGVERHLSRGITLGFAATFLQSTQTYTGGLGKLDLEGPTLSTYLAYVKRSFWSSLLYSFGDYDLGSSRNPGLGLPVASGATNAYVNSVQFNTGWNFRFQNKTLVTGPFVGIDYLHGSVDAYNETGGGAGALHYNKQTFESLVTRVGWSLSKKFETNWAAITPQLRLSYERQNLKNNGTSVSLINAPFSATGGNQSPGQDYLVIGTGVNFQFTPDFSLLLGYQTQLFRNNMTAHFGSVRFGYKF